MPRESMNIVDENIRKIQELFPSVVKEAKDEQGKNRYSIDSELLAQELSNDLIGEGKERFQMSWPGKRKAIITANSPTDKTLRPLLEKSVNFDTTENIYIEGDNLDALKILRESYLGKVKMIYIDPPYNTGHDFIYEDNFSISDADYKKETNEVDENGYRMRTNPETNGRFHSDWLNMIYPRLRLAKDFLTDDGVIFISIDDNEQANLRKICDEIFGEDNFQFQIAWRRTDNQPNIGQVARVKEYILCFCKNKQKVCFNKLPLTEKALSEYRYQDSKGRFRRAILLDKTRGRYHYNVKTKSGKIIDGPWMKTQEEFERLNSDGLIYWTDSGDELPYGKIYLSDGKGQIPNDFWGIDFGTNQRGSNELNELLGGRFFDFPKPLELIKSLIRIGSNLDSTILDFFSGSATTAHAVMEINAADGGKRKFIMVQVPELCEAESKAFKAGFRNICEIGERRIVKAAEKIQNEQPLVTSHYDFGMRVFAVDSTNFKDISQSPANYTLEGKDDNIKENRSDLDLVFQCLLDLGILLSNPIEKKDFKNGQGTYYSVNNGDLICCFAKNVTEDNIQEMASMKPLYAVFRDSSFFDDSASVNCEQIFKTISPTTELKIL